MNEKFNFCSCVSFPSLHVLICSECFNSIAVVLVPHARVFSFAKKKRRQQFFFLPIFLMPVENNFIQPTVPHVDGHHGHQRMLMKNFLQSCQRILYHCIKLEFVSNQEISIWLYFGNLLDRLCIILFPKFMYLIRQVIGTRLYILLSLIHI